MSHGPIVHGPEQPTSRYIGSVFSGSCGVREPQYGALGVPHDYYRSFVFPFVKQTPSASVGGTLELR